MSDSCYIQLAQHDVRLMSLVGLNLFQVTVAHDEMTFTLTVLCAVFLLTQLPMAIYAIYRLFLSAKQQHHCEESVFLLYKFLTSIPDTLTVVNSSVNFLIYYPSAVTFRRTMQQMFSRISFTSSSKSSNNRQNYVTVEQST